MDGVDLGSAPFGLGGLVLAADLAFGAARAALDLTLGLSLSCLALALASVFGLVAFVGGPAGDVEEADEDSDFLVTAFFAMVFFTGMALVAFGLGRAGDGELEEDGGGFFFTAGFF